jgi:acyl-CoA synthetase (AMP-forming)/AMP-acid ligase II
MVVGGPKSRSPVTQNLVNSGLEQNKAIISPGSTGDTRVFVGCGQNLPGQQIIIVNTETLTPCLADEIGEIWVNGPSVTGGYWNKPRDTERTFGARLFNSGEGPFLRTGDLGFIYEGELYITGRLKNLIITEGKNHYPHDIERTVELSHPAIRPGGCAVFSISKPGDEHIIIIAELEQKLVVKKEEVIKAIHQAVSIHHELQVYDIRLTNPGSIPRTTSGKIRHFLCKTHYMAGAVEEIIVA